jgi:transposase
MRDLLRKRTPLVAQQSANVVSIQHIILRNTGARLSTPRLKPCRLAELERLFPDGDQALAVSSGLAVVHWLAEQIQRVAKRVQAQLRSTPLYKLLQTVPGIGPILAQTILLDTGDIGRLAHGGAYASYCRCVDSTKLSNGKRKGHGNIKNGHPDWSWAYAEAATFALRWHPQVQRYSQRTQANTKVPVARKTVAHTLARACYHLRRDQGPFEVATACGAAMVAIGPRREAGCQDGA